AVVVFVLNDFGTIVFWIGGLVLAAFVGPAQAASRSLLARVTPIGLQGEIFGLYATTGRVASFISPALWTLAIAISGSTIFGVLGVGTSRPSRRAGLSPIGRGGYPRSHGREAARILARPRRPQGRREVLGSA